MEPLPPKNEKAIADDAEASSDAAAGELQEYERLLSEMFLDDPDEEPSPDAFGVDAVGALPSESPRVARQRRIKELYGRLFPAKDSA